MRRWDFHLVLGLCALAGTFATVATSCAGTECNFNSQCGPLMYCLEGRCGQDCRRDVDCAGGLVCSSIGRCEAPSADAGMDVIPDTALPPDARPDGPPIDSRVDTRVPDTSVDTRMDTMVMGSGIYLDRCTMGIDCMSGECVDDVGGSRFCTKTCATHSDCADEHVCNGTICLRDDTGESCALATPGSCSLGLCAGSAGGVSSCTRDCTNAGDCPSGYACSRVGGMKVCVDIERPCSAPGDCVGQSCLSIQGCTATCETAADCPSRLSGLPPYTCEVAFGSAGPICVPPVDIMGADATGTFCSFAGMVNLCRSGACNSADPLGPTCVQSCGPEGGCGPGLGCFPEPDVGGFTYVCVRSGNRALGSACASARDCDSSLCWDPGYCTRLCFDGFCPTGMTCQVMAGVALCLR